MVFEVTGEQAMKPWHEISFAKIIPRTSDTKSFRFKKPDGFQHQAGQWMYVNIKVNDLVKLHHFTISSSPTEDFLVFTKKITDSDYSKALDHICEGDWAKISGPYGSFTYAGEPIKIGALTGGIGITPLRSICKYCADKTLPTSIVMLYSNKTRDEIVFKEQLDEMMASDPNIDVRYVLTRQPDWNGLKGHIDGDMIKAQIPDYKDRTFYICGPPAMNQALKKALGNLVPESQIKLEDFTGYE